MTSLLVSNLTVDHGAIRALSNVSFEVKQGEITAVIGANGAGKTTLLRTLSGLKAPSNGTVTWRERNILNKKPEDLVRRGISHVSEGKSVIPELSVHENLLIGGLWRRNRSDTNKAIAEAVELFPRLGERMDQSANTLSGGERQMLAIGRALVSRPKLLLLDEPSLGLAPLIIEQIFTAVQRMRTSLGMTVVLVEQNAASALAVADTGVILNLGELVAAGDARDLLADPALKSAYLGF
ncbi:MAG: ABC transporter ATP-binding protein [Actinomycetales bacterium]|nr:ABC transporter ATP-binding protein [Actinomycetales bacterium]